MADSLTSNVLSDVLNIGQMPSAFEFIAAVGQHYAAISSMLGAIAYCGSFIMLYIGILHLSRMGDQSSRITPGGLILIFACSLMLAYFPALMNTISNTLISSNGNPFTYSTKNGFEDQVKASMEHIYHFLGLAGVAAAIRGIWIWKSVGEGSQSETFGKGFWHIFGGWCAVHLDDVVTVLKSTAGWN